MRLRLLGVGASDGTYIKSAQINKSEILTYRDRFFCFTLSQTTKALRESRGIALLYFRPLY